MFKTPRQKRARLTVALLGSVSLVGLSACGSAGAGSEGPAPLRVDITPSEVNFVPLMIALDRGYFEAEGLEMAAPTTSQGGPASNQLLMAGELDIALIGTQTAIQNAAGGRPTPAVCAVRHNLNEDLIVTTEAPRDATYPEIMESVRGKKIGVPARGLLLHFMLNGMLADAGMSEDDIQLVTMGKGSVNQMQAGTVDGMLTGADNTWRAENGGFGEAVVNTADIPQFADSLSLVYVLSPDLAKSNPEVGEKFCAAVERGIEDLKDEAQRTEVAEIFSGYSDLPVADAEDMTTYFLNKTEESFSTELPEVKIQHEIEFANKYAGLSADVTPSQLVLGTAGN